MFTKTTGFIIIPLWVAAMSWLVAHDVVPVLTAHPSPPLKMTDWRAGDELQSQFSIHDSFGKLGTVWSEYMVDDRSIRRDDLVWIERWAIPIAPLRVNVHSIFTSEGVLDELTVRFVSRAVDVRLHGERFHADFSFTLESGPLEKAFKVPLTDGGLISGAFHPFTAMTNLRVGQRWRMQVVNPIACLTGVGSRLIPMLVEVTGEERIRTPGGDRNCMVIESQHAKAWVDAGGAVQVQEMKLPMMGTLRMVREARFDEVARSAVRNRNLVAP